MAKEQHCDSESSKPLRKKWKAAISVLIILHLLAVFLPPLAFQASGAFGSSPSVGMLLRPVEGYGQFIYADRGYAFFAPDPGPSHLIQAAVTGPDGEVEESLYPDLSDQWPRLMYHRHFMLAEFLNDIYQPPGPPQELIENDRAAADEWARLRARYEHVRQSVVDHLRATNDGKEVAIRRIEHLIPTFIEFLEEPISLDDRRLYTVLLDQEVDAPLESIPSPASSTDSAAADGDDQRLTAPASKTDREMQQKSNQVQTAESSSEAAQ